MLWCWSRTAGVVADRYADAVPKHDRYDEIIPIADRFHEKEIKSLARPLRRGGRLSVAGHDRTGWGSYVAESFAGIYVLVLMRPAAPRSPPRKSR